MNITQDMFPVCYNIGGVDSFTNAQYNGYA